MSDEKHVTREDGSLWEAQAIPVEPSIPAAIEGLLEMPEGTAECSDSANAFRLLAWWGHELRYIPELGGWHVYDGRRWTLDEPAAMRLAQATTRRMLIEAGEDLALAVKALAAAIVAGDDDAETGAKKRKSRAEFAFGFATRSQNAKALKNLLELAQAHATLAPAALDADPYLLNCENGTLELRTGRLRAQDRKDLITKLAPVEYRGLEETHPALERYLSAATEGREGLREFIRRMAGLMLIGENPQEAFFVAHGAAGTGKTTLLEALAAMLGSYACAADVATFLAPQGASKNAGDARPDLAKLAGRRLVICSEVPKGRRFDEALVKKITSDTITARKLYRDEFEFPVSFKVLMGCNDAPKISPDEEAIWRRLHLVPLDRVVAEEERDPQLKALLKNPAMTGSALLAFAMTGCLEVQVTGLLPPPCVKEATASYKEAQDPLREFLEERCVLGTATDWATGPELRKQYEEWAKEAGAAHLLGPDSFGKRLRAKGCTVKPCNIAGKTTRVWYGIRLRTRSDDVADRRGEPLPPLQ